MTLPIRSFIAFAVLIVILAACGTATSGTPEPTAPVASPTEPSETPSETPAAEPSEAPADEPEVVGTLTMVDGVSVGGPGGSIADAIASGMTDPMLVNGALFMDTDGTIYLASSLADASAPEFEGPMLEVIGYPENGAEWDPANAADTGLQQANGILFFETAQLYGVVEAS